MHTLIVFVAVAVAAVAASEAYYGANTAGLHYNFDGSQRYFSDQTGNTVRSGYNTDENNDGVPDRYDSNRDGQKDTYAAPRYGYHGNGNRGNYGYNNGYNNGHNRAYGYGHGYRFGNRQAYH